MVFAYSIVGQLAAEGAVELVGIDIEVRPPAPDPCDQHDPDDHD